MNLPMFTKHQLKPTDKKRKIERHTERQTDRQLDDRHTDNWQTDRYARQDIATSS